MRPISTILPAFPQIPVVLTARLKSLALAIAGVAIALAWVGALLPDRRLAYAGLGTTAAIVVPILLPALRHALLNSPLGRNGQVTIAAILALAGVAIGGSVTQLDERFWQWFNGLNWDALGAFGQILIAILAVWVAWRQNEISEKLTGQQNVITQQQTIDAYFQGISDLVLDDRGQMEDWPLERAIAQARTAALLNGADPEGRAKVLRFLSSANLLTPLKRDGLLGRPILDGAGGYVVDLAQGVRVVNLGVMLAGKSLAGTDLRWTDLSGANLIKTNFDGCNLTSANFSGAILLQASFRSADLSRTRFFYGNVDTATPRLPGSTPNFETGEATGAAIEGADFSEARDLSEEQRQYLCMWGGSKTRRTIPGGCGNIPNRLREA